VSAADHLHLELHRVCVGWTWTAVASPPSLA
jgi:hypothetical protein